MFSNCTLYMLSPTCEYTDLIKEILTPELTLVARVRLQV